MVPSPMGARSGRDDAGRDRPPAVVEVRRGWKSYGGAPALAGADFQLHANEIHVLAGPNGAGKSTLVKVIGGAVALDRGDVLLDGHRCVFASPRDSMRAGIALVSQEGSLVPTLSVAENLVLGGRHARRSVGINWRGTREHASRLLQSLGDDIDVRLPVSVLPSDERQIVEIVRAISFESTVLVLDEPTTFLDAGQTSRLFEILHELRGAGTAILIISHRLDEMLRVGDRFTVMRDGRVVASAPAGDVDDGWLVGHMMNTHGQTAAAAAPAVRGTRAHPDQSLSVSNLADAGGRVRDVSFDLSAGEIVGLGGVIGSGQSELLETIFGARRRLRGDVTVAGTPSGRTPIAAIHCGMGFVPDDRRGKALVGQLSVLQNMLMASRTVGPRMSMRGERKLAEQWCERLAIKTPDVGTRVDRLSGGNQQKVVIARWLVLSPSVLLLNEPTRGVDIAGKREIHRLLREFVARGASVLFASSEVEELQELADRVLVMRNGSVIGDLARSELTTEAITAVANGLRPHRVDKAERDHADSASIH
jgi:ABC-type sugar transport system ATPase subunit